MQPGKASLVIPVLLSLLSTLAVAVPPDRISGAVDSGQRVALAGHVHANAQARFDQGAVEPSFRLDYVTLITVPSASQQTALARLLAEQQNPSSPNYHRWLTPEQYADRFGLSQGDTHKIAEWLQSKGFKIERVARGRNWIAFSGNALQVQNAFHTEIHRYNVDGELHFANATAPAIPAGLRGIVTGIRGLHDFHPKPLGVSHNTRARPFYNSSSFGDLVAPGDVYTIYDLRPLYAAGIDGTGQKLVVAGQTDIYLADITDFRTGFGLSPISCTTNSSGVIAACNTANFQYVLGGADPGVVAGDLSEADLDIEWSGAVAPKAKIIFVTSNNAFTSYTYAIDNQLAPVISLSYGLCELQDEGFLAGDETELKKGNTLGITLVNSTGDTGVSECESNGSSLATTGLAVSYPASSPEVTGVGGTAIPFGDLNGNTTFWGTANATDGGTAVSYIPETVWNDDEEFALFCAANPTNSFCTGNKITSQQTAQQAIGISSAGGGASNCATTNGSGVCTAGFPQPAWQTVTIPGQASARFSPDVSMMASPNFPGYIFCTTVGELQATSNSASACAPGGATGITNALNISDSSGPTPSIIGGTSVSTPVFAGIIALMNQFLQGSSAGLGNINPTLYTLAKTPSNTAFHQVTSGNNIVFCAPGTPAAQPVALRCPAGGSFGYTGSNFDATNGYNLVTGLGSVDANNLGIAWAATLPSFTLSASPTSLSTAAGQSTGSTTITITPQTGFTGTVALTCSGLPSGATCNFTTVNATSSTLVIQTQANMAAASNLVVTINGTSGPFIKTTTVSLTVTATTENFTLSASPATLSLQPGQTTANTVNLTVKDNGSGFIVNNQTSLPLTYTCTVSPPAAEAPVCTFSPGSGQNISVTNPTVAIVTVAPVTMLRPLERRSPIFYAMLLPGLAGIVCIATGKSRKGSPSSAMRLLGLMLVLGSSTLWLGACGGSNNNGQKNPGTPPGSYKVTVNATTGGASPIQSSATFTVTVQ